MLEIECFVTNKKYFMWEFYIQDINIFVQIYSRLHKIYVQICTNNTNINNNNNTINNTNLALFSSHFI